MERLIECTDGATEFRFPPQSILTGPDEVLANLVGALRATVAYPDDTVQALAANTLNKVRVIQKAARRKVAAQQREFAIKRLSVIIDFVECHFRLEPGTLRGPRKPQRTATARQIAYWLCRTLTGISFPLIGESLGRDHSSVITGFNLIQRRVSRDGGFRLALEEIERELTTATTTAAA
jgi:chromosomal replication initiation ATPase DnaA